MAGPKPQTNGTIDKVPCPHCGAPQDFRELNTQEGTTLFPGTEIFCDDCGWGSQVAVVKKVTIVYLKPTTVRDPQWKPGQQHGGGGQQRQVKPPGFVQRLLGGGKR